MLSIDTAAGLADGAPAQPPWHATMMRKVASDALNITGAALHPQRREIFLELRGQLIRALTARRLTRAALKRQKEKEEQKYTRHGTIQMK